MKVSECVLLVWQQQQYHILVILNIHSSKGDTSSHVTQSWSLFVTIYIYVRTIAEGPRIQNIHKSKISPQTTKINAQEFKWINNRIYYYIQYINMTKFNWPCYWFSVLLVTEQKDFYIHTGNQLLCLKDIIRFQAMAW
jgi:hypothetical protein